eukprot:7247739-Alexandrium_andersonii.AAC.1
MGLALQGLAGLQGSAIAHEDLHDWLPCELVGLGSGPGSQEFPNDLCMLDQPLAMVALEHMPMGSQPQELFVGIVHNPKQNASA